MSTDMGFDVALRGGTGDGSGLGVVVEPAFNRGHGGETPS